MKTNHRSMKLRNPYSEFEKEIKQTRPNEKKQTHTHRRIIIKLLKYKDKGITLNVARENKHKIQKKKIYALP